MDPSTPSDPEHSRTQRTRARSRGRYRQTVQTVAPIVDAKRRFIRFSVWTALAVLVASQVNAWAQVAGHGSSGSDGALAILRDVGVVFLLVLLSAVFVMVEAAFLSVRRTRVDQLVEEGNRAAHVVRHLLSEPTRLLATLQVGLTLIQLFSAGEATSRFEAPLAAWLVEAAPGTIIARYSVALAMILIISSVGLVTLVVGEVIPKSIAVQRAESIVLLFAFPVKGLQTAARPLVAVITALSSILVKPFGGSVSFHPSALSEEEIKIMVEQSEERGVIEGTEREMIHKVFELGDTRIREVMTPRLDVDSVEADSPITEAVRVAIESGHSRIPVYDDNLDNIVGIVHAKDLMQAMVAEKRPATVREILRLPRFVPENKRVDNLLREFQRDNAQIAIVRDEYGTVTGLVTVEDLVEEIVGDIRDEYDTEEPEVTQLDEMTTLVDGRMAIEDFNERMGVEVPIGESDTMGGFVFGLLGDQPIQGESIDWHGLKFTVEKTDGRRIMRVRITRIDAGRDPEIQASGSDPEGPST